MPTLNCHSCAATHTGLVRETNEDSLVCRDDIGLWAVADGLGGHAAGDVASQAVTRGLESVPECDDIARLLARVGEAIDQTNSDLNDMEGLYGPGRAPGSTVAVLLIRGCDAAITWAGDSRVYRLRAGELEQMTRDHSHVQELVDAELIREEEAESHPMAHAITRAVGIDRTLELDSAEVTALAGDRYLLCTDGLSRLLAPAEIREFMSLDDMEESLQALLDTVLSRGAPDNVTIVAVACEE